MLWIINLRGFLSYLRYLCLLAHNGVQHMLWFFFVFFCLRRVPCVHKVSSFSRLSILDFHYGFLERLFNTIFIEVPVPNQESERSCICV